MNSLKGRVVAMHIRKEVNPFIVASMLTGILLTLALWGLRCCTPVVAAASGGAVSALLSGYFLYFFRDPERTPPSNPCAVVSGADGVVASIERLQESEFLHADCVRISIFLSLFDVHVNRAPISGQSTFKGYFPGKRYFTFQEKSSQFNQHNTILIEGDRIRCLVYQIVGPVCRRVVYWLPHDCPTPVAVGERIGMMKFGSRMDIYLPASDVIAVVHPGDRVRAGETVIAKRKGISC